MELAMSCCRSALIGLIVVLAAHMHVRWRLVSRRLESRIHLRQYKRRVATACMGHQTWSVFLDRRDNMKHLS